MKENPAASQTAAQTREARLKNFAYNLRQERRSQWNAALETQRQALTRLLPEMAAQTPQSRRPAGWEQEARRQVQAAAESLLAAQNALEAATEADEEQTCQQTAAKE